MRPRYTAQACPNVWAQATPVLQPTQALGPWGCTCRWGPHWSLLTTYTTSSPTRGNYFYRLTWYVLNKLKKEGAKGKIAKYIKVSHMYLLLWIHVSMCMVCMWEELVLSFLHVGSRVKFRLLGLQQMPLFTDPCGDPPNMFKHNIKPTTLISNWKCMDSYVNKFKLL